MSTHLEETPLHFWNTLFEEGEAYKSIPFENYDFYHDCIIRHLEKNQIAIIDNHKWSYSQIHERVSSQIPIWKEFGLNAEDRIAIALPQGIDFVVALMTALRLGLSFSIHPLEDPYLGSKRLKREVKQPNIDAVITLPGQDLGEKILEWNLNPEIEMDLTSPSHTYQAGDTVFDSLDANGAFLYPLRDGKLTLSLKRSTVWARPLSSMLHDEPFATIAAFLAGATLFHISNSALIEAPQCLKNEAIEVLGVAPRLLDLWIKTPGAPHSKIYLWYKSPFLGNLKKWETFNELNTLQKKHSAELLIQPERGGITLASTPKPYAGVTFMKPSLGIPWKILDLSGNGEESWEGVGYFDLNPRLILGEVQESFVISKTTLPIQKGDFYPSKEVEQHVDGLEFSLGCIVMEDRDPNDMVGSRVTLIIFVSPEKQFVNTADWEEKAHQTINQEVGEAYLPDRVLFYPFYPNRKEGEIDRNWVLGQYHGGLLPQKKRSPAIHHLNLFRQAVGTSLWT